MPHLEPPSDSQTQTIESSAPTRATKHFDVEVLPGGRAAAWVRPGGELDLAAAPHLKQTLAEALGTTRLVVLDLRELTFMDSTGVHAIVEADSEARRNGRRLVLVRGPAQIHRLLKLTGVADRLEIIDGEPMLVSPKVSAPDPPEAA